jgi:tetratricopeptide (TPR) repeat protein
MRPDLGQKAAMPTNAFDLQITARPETVAALDEFSNEFLGYGKNLGALFPAADADPGAPLIQAYAAALHRALEAVEGWRAADPYAGRAHENAHLASPGERRVIEAFDIWAQGDPMRAAMRLLDHVRAEPKDILAAKWGQYLAFNVGDAGLMLALARAIMPAHDDTAEAYGMLAFGLEQTHRLDEAEAMGREALKRNRADAWAQHAVAHVMETQGRVDEGIGFLRAHSGAWADRSVFMREHNWWHLALFHMDQDEPQEALSIYDAHLWGEWPEFAQEQIGAISALWRMELRGVDVGARWRAISQKVAARGPEHIWPFHDMHYVHALARSGETRALDRLLASMEKYATYDAPEPLREIWGRIALPLARGIAAHATGRHSEAARLIGPLVPHLSAIGGSHAQRDVFVQAWLDSAIKAGEKSAAADMLEKRLAVRPNIRSTHRLLTLCRISGFPSDLRLA